jgi:hypothetical protein
VFRNTAHVYDLVYSGKDYEAEAAAKSLRQPSLGLI